MTVACRLEINQCIESGNKDEDWEEEDAGKMRNILTDRKSRVIYTNRRRYGERGERERDKEI